MNRRYRTRQFAKMVDLCRKTVPDAAIGIDVLVGFPGETDKNFANTTSFLEDLDCTYLHVFPYSKRPGTIASTFKNQVSKPVKEERVALIRALGERKKADFYRKHIHTKRPVLVEGNRDEKGLLKGFTDNYIPVTFSGDDNLINTIVTVKLLKIVDTHVFGTPAGNR
jgi:threonylcarbamoyladenosine tRNA methylthiotransferase MtaB